MERRLERFLVGLAVCIVFFGSGLPGLAEAEVPTGAVAYWKLDECSGTIANDETTNSNDGILINSPLWSTGISGCGLAFDGTDDSVSVSNSTSLNPTNEITVELWAKSDTTTWNDDSAFVYKADAYKLVPVKDTKILGFYIYDNGWQSVSYTSSNNITSWHHYVGTYDGTKLKIYEDAAKKNDTTYSGDIDSSANDLYMGTIGSAYFQGSLDEVVIYSNALTDEEIEDRFNFLKVSSTIDSISPSPAYVGESVCFAGHGDPAPGLTITDYRWISDISGQLAKTDSFCNNNLSAGVHTISFSAEDSDGDWSLEDSWLFTVNDLPAEASDLALELTDIYFSDPHPAPGSVTDITATIHNIGNTISNSSIYVNFYYDDNSTISNHTIGNYTISNAIAAGASDAASIAWTVPNQADCYVAKVEVEQDANEKIIDNNTAARIITVGSPGGSCPDIEVDFEPSSYTVCNGQAFYVNGKAEYVWSGGTRLPVLGADVSIDLVLDGWQTHTDTYGHFSKKITAPFLASGSPDRDILATATDYTLIGSTTKNITIDCPLYSKDLTASPRHIYPQEHVNANSIINLEAVISNLGCEEIYSNFLVSYEILNTGEYREALVSNPVPPYSDTLVNFGRWQTPDDDVKTPYTSKVIVDVDDEIAEDREHNNTITNEFAVYPARVDLTPTSIYPYSVSLCNGGSVTNSVTNKADIYNVGGADSEQALVYFGSVSNVTLDNVTVTVSNISKWEQEKETVSFQWAPVYSELPKTYDVWTSITCVNENIAQTANNNISRPVTVYPAPVSSDLLPVDISYPTLYIENESVFATTVKNAGCTTSSPTYVEFSLIDSTLGSTHLDPLAPGAETTVNFIHTFQDSGSYSFCAETKEAVNTANNLLCEWVKVYSVWPDLKVESSDISFSNATPSLGVPMDIYATIHNLGVATATDYKVYFFEYETSFLGSKVASTPLLPDDSNIYTSVWIPDTSGTNVIKVAVSPIDPAYDANDENNEATRYTGVCSFPPSITRAYWKFDEGYGTITNDETENGNDGTLINSPAWVPGGIQGSALRFYGWNYVNIEDNSSLDLTDAFTIEAWIRAYTAGGGNQGRIISKHDGSSGWEFFLGDSYIPGIHKKLALRINGSIMYNTYGSLVGDPGLHHVAVAYEAGVGARFFIDGVPTGTATNYTGSINTNNSYVQIGKYGGYNFNGIIDEPIVYNEALSDSQVYSHFIDYDDTTAPAFSGLGAAADVKTGGLVYLSWNAATDADNTVITYSVFYSSTSGGQNFSSPNATTKDTHYLVSGLTNDQVYYFVVRATDVFGNVYENTVEKDATPTDSLHSGTVGYWKFDEGSGTIANDETGYENDGTIYGATWTSGFSSDALDFDGVNGYVTVADHPSLNPTNALTIEAWIKADTAGGGNRGSIISKNDGSSGWEFFLGNYYAPGWPKKLGLRINGLVMFSENGSIVGKPGLHHVAAVYEKNVGARFLIDGVSAGTVTNSSSINTNNSDVQIGKYAGGGYNFNGIIDEPIVYNVALSDTQVHSRFIDYDNHYAPTFSGLYSATDNRTCGVVNLSWNAASDDDNTEITYSVFYSSTSGGQNYSIPYATTTDTSYQVTGLTDDQEYYFVVRATDLFGNENTNTNAKNATPTGTLPPEPVAYWKFDEGTGTIAHDESDNNNDGTIYYPSWTSGISGSALHFAQGEYLNAGNDSSLRITEHISVEAWFKLNGSRSSQVIVSKTQSGGYGLSESGGQMKFAVHTDGSYKIAGISTSEIALNAWNHVVGTYDGSKVRFYLNGVERDNTDATGHITDTPDTCTFIGEGSYYCKKSNPSLWFDGNIDEVAIYNQALSESQVYSRLIDYDDPNHYAPTFSGLGSATDAGTGGAVDLSWNAASDDQNTAITYSVFYSSTPGGQNFSNAYTTTNTTLSNVTGLTNDQEYFFVVRANDVFGNENTNTVEKSATPIAP